MSDCHRCAALRMIAYDVTLTAAEMAQLARDALDSHAPCARPADQIVTVDYQRIAALPDPSYDPDDMDNPMLEMLLPSVLRINGGNENE